MTNIKSNITNLNLYFRIVVVIAVVLAVANIILSNKLSTEGKTLNNLDQAIAAQQKTNTYMKQQIAENTSLSHIEGLATNLGFVSISQPVALKSPVPVAYVPNLRQ